MQNLLNVVGLDDAEVEILLELYCEMRLEIKDMSYEEFITLCKRICSVSIDLSEETIMAQLDTKFYKSTLNSINLEEFPYDAQEIDVFITCQTEFKHQKKIGIRVCVSVNIMLIA